MPLYVLGERWIANLKGTSQARRRYMQKYDDNLTNRGVYDSLRATYGRPGRGGPRAESSTRKARVSRQKAWNPDDKLISDESQFMRREAYGIRKRRRQPANKTAQGQLISRRCSYTDGINV